MFSSRCDRYSDAAAGPDISQVKIIINDTFDWLIN